MLSIALAFQQCTTERDALMAIFNTNGGILWTGAGLWGTGAPVCSWQGVTCQNSVVVGLDLSGFGLTGILTPDIQCLKFLKSLHLNNNSLASEIPTALCALQNLQYFQANSAGFTGVIPACVCTMQHIMYFYVDNNTLSGQIPTCVGNMTYLREMHLKCNSLNGTIPTGFDTLVYLTELRVNCNVNLNCSSALSTKSNFIFICGDIDCQDCIISGNSCPLYIDIPNCPRYVPIA
ncbi:Cyst_wall protein [Hexamita inflata]|uniref:Cyst_wall protein n=1 Tax=Hexamita inflata TaxID=28002 RepID=A0ABP1HK20_9EUKA